MEASDWRQELVCIFCDHARRSHSKEGCTHSNKQLEPCSCKKGFFSRDGFTMATPKND